MGKTNALIQPHLEYSKLGKTLEERQNAYKALLQTPLESKILTVVLIWPCHPQPRHKPWRKMKEIRSQVLVLFVPLVKIAQGGRVYIR